MSKRKVFAALSALMLLAAGSASRAMAADAIADFYHGKTIRNVIGFGPGDSFDLFARLVARHMPQHIPGAPTMVVQNMPGAGSLTALNYVVNSAPQDGTVVGMVNPVATLQPLLQPELAPFDPRAINWIGSVTTDYYTCGFWTKEKVTLRDLETRHFIVGSTATTGATYAGDMVFMSALHLDFKIVPGYGSMGELNHAAEKGEVQGHCGVMATSLKSNLWPIYTAGQLQIAVRASLAPDPDLADVPNAFDLVKSAEDRQVLMLLAGPWYYGRPMLAPPATPKDRLDALRAAFHATMQDAVFLDDAKALRIDIHPLNGAQVADTIKQIYDIPKPVVERARPMFGVTGK